MQTLQSFVDHYVRFERDEWEILEQRVAYCTYHKGERIHSARERWNALYFVQSGLVRSYVLHDTGKEATRQFHFNNDKANILNLFVVDYASLSQQAPGTIGFEVLEDCALIRIDRETIDHLHDISKKWERLSRMLLESAYMEATVFYQSMMSRSAKENYRHIREHMSYLVDLAPQYHLATYIGITPVSLSRIKQELDTG